MLTLHTSNQLEALSEQFAQTIKTPLKAVFSPEIVVVQNAGMGRYLSLQVADRQGISANTDFLFPAQFMWRMLKSVLPDLSDQDPSAPAVLRWRLLQLFLNEIKADSKDFPELMHYIKNSDSAWNLSLELSNVLDKVLFYRDDWIRDWENPEVASKITPENWQARLWQKLIANKNIDHWVSLQQQFINALHENKNLQMLPERVSFFSLSALSPGYIRLLGELGKFIDLHLYIVNPCHQYWGDIESQKQILKKDKEEQTYYDSGNALLSSMGKQGRDFIEQILLLPDINEVNHSQDIEPTTLLQRIQRDIFDLRAARLITENKDLFKSDKSITINACHTVMREVEVLYNQILSTLQNNPEISPADIIVMMPDIENYMPYIEAIFSAESQNIPKLPFSIADQNPATAQESIEAFLKLLQLVDKRFDVESVFELLDYKTIRENFNLQDDDVVFCREIARATNIRWGISADKRKKSKLPATDEHTWRYALKRMLLGYAMPGDELFIPNKEGEADYLPLLPFNELEGSQAQLISHLIQYTDVIFQLDTLSSKHLTLENWLEKFNQLILSLFADESQNKLLFNTFDNIKQQASLAHLDQGLSPTLPFSLICKILKQSLQEITGNESYMGYGITFCSLVPMRSVPFKVVALLGMNDGEYPRQDTHHSFDEVGKHPKKGDRSRRDEDRYLFIESLLAAREKLIISYIGQSIKDNTTLPPSVLVSELLDELTIYTHIPAVDWICKHPLQAFSPRYFDASDTRLFSYSSEYTNLQAKNPTINDHFITNKLNPLEEDAKNVKLDDLVKFFQSPARVFLTQRFSINTFDKNLVLPIREPFAIESFKHRDIRQTILDKNNTDFDCNGTENQPQSMSSALATSRAKGLLPYGDIGDNAFEKEVHAMSGFTQKLPSFEAEKNKSFSFDIADFTLYGEINQLTEAGRFIQQTGEAFAGDYIKLWIYHLALNATGASKEKSQTHFYCPEISFLLSPIESAESAKNRLKQLLAFYWQGLHFPLKFLPKPAYNQYKKAQKKGPLNSAINSWTSDTFGCSEKDKFENWLLYKGFDEDTLFGDEFEAVSNAIFGELYAYYSEY